MKLRVVLLMLLAVAMVDARGASPSRTEIVAAMKKATAFMTENCL